MKSKSKFKSPILCIGFIISPGACPGRFPKRIKRIKMYKDFGGLYVK